MRSQIKSDATIARRLASQLWGEVQRQKKITDGFWSFDTAGHGGYVADTNKYPLLEQFKFDYIYINARSSKYYPHEQHFAAFEEDCDWAVPLYLYPEICRAEYNYRCSSKNFYENYPNTMVYLEGVVIPCIEMYHAKLLNEQTTSNARRSI